MPESENIKAEVKRIDKIDQIEDGMVTGDSDQTKRYSETYINKVEEILANLDKSDLDEIQKKSVKEDLLMMLASVIGKEEIEQFEPEFREKIDGYLEMAINGNVKKQTPEKMEEAIEEEFRKKVEMVIKPDKSYSLVAYFYKALRKMEPSAEKNIAAYRAMVALTGSESSTDFLNLILINKSGDTAVKWIKGINSLALSKQQKKSVFYIATTYLLENVTTNINKLLDSGFNKDFILRTVGEIASDEIMGRIADNCKKLSFMFKMGFSERLVLFAAEKIDPDNIKSFVTFLNKLTTNNKIESDDQIDILRMFRYTNDPEKLELLMQLFVMGIEPSEEILNLKGSTNEIVHFFAKALETNIPQYEMIAWYRVEHDWDKIRQFKEEIGKEGIKELEINPELYALHFNPMDEGFKRKLATVREIALLFKWDQAVVSMLIKTVAPEKRDQFMTQAIALKTANPNLDLNGIRILTELATNDDELMKLVSYYAVNNYSQTITRGRTIKQALGFIETLKQQGGIADPRIILVMGANIDDIKDAIRIRFLFGRTLNELLDDPGKLNKFLVEISGQRFGQTFGETFAFARKYDFNIYKNQGDPILFKNDILLVQAIMEASEVNTEVRVAFIKHIIAHTYLVDATTVTSFFEDPALPWCEKVYACMTGHEIAKDIKIDTAFKVGRNLRLSGVTLEETAALTLQQVLGKNKEIKELQKQYENISIWKDREVVIIRNGEILKETFEINGKTYQRDPSQVGKSGFACEEVIKAISESMDGKEPTVIGPKDDTPTTAELADYKAKFILAMQKPPPLTFYFAGHGGPDGMYMNNGKTTEGGQEHTSNMDFISSGEFAAAVAKRRTLFPGREAELAKDIYISAACFSANCIEDVRDRLKVLGGVQPILIPLAEYGQYGPGYGAEDHQGVYAVLGAGKANVTLGDVIRDAEKGITDITVYVPDNKGISQQIVRTKSVRDEKEGRPG